MGFEAARRFGRFWNDAQQLDRFINDYHFNTSGKDERSFELGFSNALYTSRERFESEVITQTNNDTSVRSVYCFGKKHRPDMALDPNGIAVELKYITYAGLKDAIGQGYLYRLQYKFVFLVLIIGSDRKKIYEDLSDRKENDLEEILQHLADEMNIFTYIVPAFKLKPGVKKCYSFFQPLNQ